MSRTVGMMGKLKPQFPVALKDMHCYATAPLPKAPDKVDHAGPVTEGFPMDGNDQYGDCTMAAAAHMIQAWNAQTGIDLPVPADADVIAQYLKLSRGKDSGLVESRVLQDWMRDGLWETRIVGYAPVNVHSLEGLKQAIAYFGGVYVGIQVPGNAESQFADEQPWALVPDWQSQPIKGGHAVPLLGYDEQFMYCVTWGAVQKMTWDWWSVYGDEAWVILSEEYQKAGKIGGIDVAMLKADLGNL
ncbi:hypothetical protein GCM10009839_21730 [Catenulispora yoronensis]|uniref:Peptidase C39-like domain-containing protein n=1 Tax=Catenulispora yoronensis TaxID=450799 RepID=A0ABP5FFZ9_9ACTN